MGTLQTIVIKSDEVKKYWSNLDAIGTSMLLMLMEPQPKNKNIRDI